MCNNVKMPLLLLLLLLEPMKVSTGYEPHSLTDICFLLLGPGAGRRASPPDHALFFFKRGGFSCGAARRPARLHAEKMCGSFIYFLLHQSKHVWGFSAGSVSAVCSGPVVMMGEGTRWRMWKSALWGVRVLCNEGLKRIRFAAAHVLHIRLMAGGA